MLNASTPKAISSEKLSNKLSIVQFVSSNTSCNKAQDIATVDSTSFKDDELQAAITSIATLDK